MTNFLKYVVATALIASPALAGPKDAIERNLTKNGAFVAATGFSGVEHKNGTVSISGRGIATDHSSGGVHANPNSVVTTSADSNCTTGTRVQLKTGHTSPCA
jgi:hypothetical protein